MLKVSGLQKSYGGKTLFNGVSFTMTPGERLGLVGRNGSGKTTLFRLILEQEAADAGAIEMPRRYTVGHLSQHLRFDGGTILEQACSGLPVQEGGWVEQYKAEEALMGLGFEIADFDRSPSELSGGFQVRLQLATALLSSPNLLLLDEPTNYLDIVSVRWLQRYLRSWPGEIMLITHDRQFMDRVTTHTMAIHRGMVRRIPGNTDKLYELLATEEEIHEKTRLNEAKARRQAEAFINRFRAKATKARQVQSRVKALAKRSDLDKLADIADLEFSFNSAAFPAHTLLQCEDLAFGYDDHENLFEELRFAIDQGDRVAVIGKNGKGKTTLLNVLAGELRARTGTLKRHPSTRLGYFGQNNIDRLHPGHTVEQEIMAAHPTNDRRAARGICGVMMFEGDDALKTVDVLSGGERARVLLGKLLVSPTNLLLLDEPTNHLDMESVDSLIEAVDAFAGGVLIVTHSERLLHALATRLLIFDRGVATMFEGSYRDFLDRVGWSDEGDGKKKNGTDKKPAGGNQKKQRRQRAKNAAARTAALRPLQKKITALEDAIESLEGKLAATNELLCQASTAADSDAITTHGRTAAELQQEIDKHFEQLEVVTAEHDQSARSFDQAAR